MTPDWVTNHVMGQVTCYRFFLGLFMFVYICLVTWPLLETVYSSHAKGLISLSFNINFNTPMLSFSVWGRPSDWGASLYAEPKSATWEFTWTMGEPVVTTIYYVEEILRMLAELWELLEVLELIENFKWVLCQTSTCCNIDTQLGLLCSWWHINFRFSNSMNTTGTIYYVEEILRMLAEL
jgi:hypothetical protein